MLSNRTGTILVLCCNSTTDFTDVYSAIIKKSPGDTQTITNPAYLQIVRASGRCTEKKNIYNNLSI